MRVRDQVHYNAFRVNYLLNLWNDEIAEYQVELYASEDPEHKYMVKHIDTFDQEKVKEFLKVYIERCTFKHSFAYLQYRRLASSHKLEDLGEVFEDRKIYLLRNMNQLKSNLYNGAYQTVEKEDKDSFKFDESGNPAEPKALTQK